MEFVVLVVVFGAVMILVSKLTRKRPDDPATGAGATTIPDIGTADRGADGGSDSGGDGGGDGN
jgi:hypothetical protein